MYSLTQAYGKSAFTFSKLFFWPFQTMKVHYRAVELVIGIIKDVCGTKVLSMTVSAYHVDWVSLCYLLNTQYCCLCPNKRFNLPSVTQPPTTHPMHSPLTHLFVHAICDVTVSGKKLLKIQQC